MNKWLYSSTKFLKRNMPTILTCVGGAGVIATTVAAVKATPKATALLQQAKREKGEKLTVLEKVKTAGPVYVPTVLLGAGTIACIFGANTLSRRQQASLMSAYVLLDNSYKEYKDKVIDLYGKKADEEIREELAKDKYEENPYPVEDNKVLFYDEYGERYFESTMEDVLRAELLLNRDFQYHGIALLNEFYELLKLPKIEAGEYLGWSVTWLCESQWLPFIEFYHKKVEMDDGLECYILNIATEPVPEGYFDNY